MQEVVHRCDRPVGKSGNPCGERVPDDKPTRFCLDDEEYEADLCERHRNDLDKALSVYIEMARRPARTTTPKKSTAVRTVLRGKKGTFTQRDVREWLKQQGRDVASSGRLPNEFIEEYKQAQEEDLV